MGKPKRDVDELREEIEAIILRGADDFFDAPEDRSALEVTVRICSEFYDFLMGAVDPPDASDANYMASQIRSGIEEHFTLEQYGRVLSGLKLQEGFSGKLPQTFGELKTEYEAIFQQVLDCDVSAKAFGLLLSLTKLMLLFLTVYFQSFRSYSAPDAAGGD
ncbi:MAG TPA: hypothetical protein VN933_14030 [Candidatus Eremiobacteraceae bacterium]|nr:hypothetical protein [Candidatus Eremiobacteraceae bacterium]